MSTYEAEVVTLHVKRGTANWLNWGALGDRQRGKARAVAARRMIELWETINRLSGWISIVELVPEHDSYRRWVRRNIYTFENAGLVETRMESRRDGLYFRVLPKRKRK